LLVLNRPHSAEAALQWTSLLDGSASEYLAAKAQFEEQRLFSVTSWGAGFAPAPLSAAAALKSDLVSAWVIATWCGYISFARRQEAQRTKRRPLR
jgi:hypothetical protein